jgi:hypothetical protein
LDSGRQLSAAQALSVGDESGPGLVGGDERMTSMVEAGTGVGVGGSGRARQPQLHVAATVPVPTARKPERYALNHKPLTLNPFPYTLNSTPEIINP